MKKLKPPFQIKRRHCRYAEPLKLSNFYLRFPGQGRPGMSLYAGKQPAFAQGGHELPDIGGDNCLTWEEDVAIMGFIIE